MTRVKICGIRTVEALAAAADAGADWIGFVFAESPRRVSPSEAAALSRAVPHGPARVGVFVDPPDDAIEAALAALTLDALQLYAAPARAAEIRRMFGLPVWRSIRADEALPRTLDGADAFIVEPPPPPDTARPGGHGRAADFASLASWRPDFPWLLAGGLTPANVAAAVKESHAPAVDVSSGVETAPGVKDPALIRAFVAAARG